MSKFSDEERRAILEQSWELLNSDVVPGNAAEEISEPELVPAAEDKLTEWRRKAAEREACRAAEHAKREIAAAKATARANAMDDATRAAWDAWCDGRIKNYVQGVLEIIAEEFATFRECQEAFQKRDDRIAALEAEVKALRGQRAELAAEPIDLPVLELRGRIQ